MFAESELYCHSILFVCLSGCLSVIPRPTAYHDWFITTKFGRQVYTCPRTRVSLLDSLSPILSVPEGKICQISPIAYSCHCERDASCHMTCLSVCLSVRPHAYLGNHSSELHTFSVHVAVGRGSVLLWRRCDTLCVFVCDVMFSDNGPHGARIDVAVAASCTR